MTNKELYRAFCREEQDLPIFMQDWWLDAVCAGKEWDVVVVRSPNGQDKVPAEGDSSQACGSGDIVAAMPYLLRKRLGMKYILMPQLTQIGGVWTKSDDNNGVAEKVAEELQKMKLSYYYQHYPIDCTVAKEMAAWGFKVKERVTYRIEDLSNLDKVIGAFSKNKKRQLQKALSLHVEPDMNVEDFYRFHVSCLAKQSKQISYTREFLLVLERKAKRQNQCQIISICNADNEVLAAAFLVWDKRSMYYLIPCHDPDKKDSGASALLVLESIKLARQQGVAFDFEGSMIKGIAQHYKQFGSKATKYYSVERYYKWWFRLANIYNKLRERKMR